ncbi:MAG: hypothetical protein STSR0008_00060 [Ignavibacterium sp.]
MMKKYFQNLPKIKLTDFKIKNIPLYLNKIKNYIFDLIKFENNPFNISLSIAIGIFVGLTIPMGFQTFFIIPLIILFRANFILAYSATYISNPITVLPIYYSALKIGEFIMQYFFSMKVIINFSKVQQMINNFSFDNLFFYGKEFLITFIIGLFIQGIIVTVLIFFISYILFLYIRKNMLLLKEKS